MQAVALKANPGQEVALDQRGGYVLYLPREIAESQLTWPIRPEPTWNDDGPATKEGLR